MPVLQASGYATPVAPTVDLLPTPPASYQDIRVPVLDAAARGLESFSQDMAKAATSFDNIAAVHNQMIVDQRRNEFDNYMNNTLHGDPSVEGDVGYMGLQGENATAKREEVRKGIDAKIAELQKGFSNQRQLHAF